jgi:protein SCO1/2
MTGVSRTVTLCLVFVALVIGMFFYTKTRVPVLSEAELRERGVILLPRPRDIAPFELQNAAGGVFDKTNLEGRWSFVFFGFTHCPDVCPTALSVMGLAERAILEGGMNEDAPFQGILVSVDPERDDAATLTRYVAGFSPRFLGVRGEREVLAPFATQLNVAFAQVPDPSDPSAYQVDHTGNIVIINPRGHYHGFIRVPHKADTLEVTYRSLSVSF